MKYIEGGKLEIIEKNIKTEKKTKREKPVLPNGTIVYCRGTAGTGYINTNGYIYLGDQINYWIIEKVVKAKLIIEDIIEEDK